jgi:hypothetical protein
MDSNQHDSISAWNFYGIRRLDIISARSSLLLRVLGTESTQLRSILRSTLMITTHWQARLVIQAQTSGGVQPLRRLHAAMRLFEIILDLTNPELDDGAQQWRSSLFDIFYHYFSVTWSDSNVSSQILPDKHQVKIEILIFHCYRRKSGLL